MDLLPKFQEQTLRLRVRHLSPTGTEVVILRPQGFFSSQKSPLRRFKEIQYTDLLSGRYESTHVALLEISLSALRVWLNEEPLLWCQYGAKFKVNKLAAVHTLTLYPYPMS
jgi:hypothetical protein